MKTPIGETRPLALVVRRENVIQHLETQKQTGTRPDSEMGEEETREIQSLPESDPSAQTVDEAQAPKGWCMLTALAAPLKNPPIVEVVCGFLFSPLTELDPLLVGKYWAENKETRGDPPFPKRRLLTPVTDRPGFTLADGVGPLRCWLISDSEEYLIQIQPDRFYFNWRKCEQAYPHFTDRGGKTGVLTRSVREFNEFSEFCRTALTQRPQVARLELGKINILEQGPHFTNLTDLATLLPIVEPFTKITQSSDAMLNISLTDFRDAQTIQLNINSAPVSDMTPAIRIETRVTAETADDDFAETFATMNAAINDVFFGLIPADQLQRFGGTNSDLR